MWLSFEEVSIGYGGQPPVLERVSFRVGTGLWAITGRNGSGKTSLLRCAAGILRPLSGRLLWNGQDAWSHPSAYRWHLGYAPQESLDLPDERVSRYLTYLAAVKGIKPALHKARVREVMAVVGLTDGALHLLSGGMKRRLLLAAALLNDPDLLILDEPTHDLDPEEKVRLRLLLQDLAQERIVLLSTHLVEEMEGMVDGWLRVTEKGVTLHGDPVRSPIQNL